MEVNEVEKVSLLVSLFSLNEKELRLILAVLEKINGLDLLSERFSNTLEKEMADTVNLSYNESSLKVLQRLNGVVGVDHLQYDSRQELERNMSYIIEQGVQLLQKNEKGFQGSQFLDLLIYEGEKVFGDVEVEQAEFKIQELLLRIIDKSDLMLTSFSSNKLREKILPFLLYYIFKKGVGEEQVVVEERIELFINYWKEKKGRFTYYHNKWEEINYSLELEKRLLEQKKSHVHNLEQQLEDMEKENDKIKKVIRQRIPHDSRKLEGLLEGKARVIAEKIAVLEDEHRLSVEKSPEKKGILHTLWNRIDQGLTGIQLEKEIKKLSNQLLEEMLNVKKDLLRFPVFYVDRIKMILENERKIQENRRWRFQLEEEMDAHEEVIQHHKQEQKKLDKEMNLIEKEYLLTRS